MTVFRELLERAGWDLEKYLHPNLNDLREILVDVLDAAGLDNISYSNIIKVSELLETFEITIGSHSDSRDYIYLPTLIVDSEDPILTAKAWAKNIELDMVKDKIKSTERALKDLYARLEVLTSCS